MIKIFFRTILAVQLTSPFAIVAHAVDGSTDEWIDPQKIRELGDKKDAANIPYLKRVKARGEKRTNSAAVNAQMALAKLGEKREMDEIVLETKSLDPAVQEYAIDKLAYVANKSAVRALIDLLDDKSKHRRKVWESKDGRKRVSDVIHEPASHQAMRVLIKIVPDGPKFKNPVPTKDDVTAWKDWWKKNKDKYQ